jgi:hypothetical protein
MTTENGIAITVSLLSALIAAWSLRESKIARAENSLHKLLNRKIELSVLLSDVQLKATEIRMLALDCLGKMMDKQLIEDRTQSSFTTALDSVNHIEELKSGIDILKLEIDESVTIGVVRLEQLHAEYAGHLRELEKQKLMLGRVERWAEESPEPSVHEERDVRSV